MTCRQNPKPFRRRWGDLIQIAAPDNSFDDELLEKIRSESFQQGIVLLEAGEAAEAVEPLRKAYVFSDRMLGVQAQETLSKKATWERALDEAALSKLRFRIGARLRVISGPYAGATGTVEKLLLRHVHAYVIRQQSDETLLQASDVQVEIDPPASQSTSA